jgi:hypothetical protein
VANGAAGAIKPNMITIAPDILKNIFPHTIFHNRVKSASPTPSYTSQSSDHPHIAAAGDNVYARQHATGVSTELTNNYYISGLSENAEKPGKIYGSDIYNLTPFR